MHNKTSDSLEAVEVDEGVTGGASVNEPLQVFHQLHLAAKSGGQSKGGGLQPFHLSKAILKDVFDPELELPVLNDIHV